MIKMSQTAREELDSYFKNINRNTTHVLLLACVLMKLNYIVFTKRVCPYSSQSVVSLITSHQFFVGRGSCEYLVNSPGFAEHGTKC